MQCSFMMDTPLARDRVVITPHFSAAQLTQGVNANALCTDLATALATWAQNEGEIQVTAYDAQGTQPVYPLGTAKTQAGIVGTSASPREVALCLSYYSQQNIPRRRGRLYIPAALASGGSVSRRPTDANLSNVGAVAGILANLGGVDVDWVVYSRANDEAYPVSNWWVDDEWDTVRSRGGTATKRIAGAVSE
jgi:hypothetical protein